MPSDRTPRPAQKGFQATMNAPFNYNKKNKDEGELNKRLNPVERFQMNQALERRGGLRFNYAPTNSNPSTRRTWVPFYENPTITESRKANYATTKIFLRNEPVRLYTGSEARRFKVDIHYSLIHMAAMASTFDITELFAVGNDEKLLDDVQAIATYLKDTLSGDTNSHSSDTTNKELCAAAADRSTSRDGPWGPNRWWAGNALRSPGRRRRDAKPMSARVGSAYWNFALMWTMRTSGLWLNHHKLLQKIINDIRNSVIGTAQTPVKGPPIVELKWGTMYNFTPCIITDYKMQPVENAGYDAKSLTSQRLKVSVSLEEMRNINGNLWGDSKIGGDLPGWDTVLDLGTMDPLSPTHPRNQEDTPGGNQ